MNGTSRTNPGGPGDRTDLPLRSGVEGEPVRDVQARLAALGFAPGGDPPGRYGAGTEAAVRAFQTRRGLRADGIVGRQTWSSLVEAGYRLGDRFLYLRSPMLRGDDVAELQRRLGSLGFDAGRIDGMFGDHTANALTEFQRNAGLTSDGICGPATVAELIRLGARSDRAAPVAAVREQERLRRSPRDLLNRRIAVGETGGLAALADALGGTLLEAGAVVVVLHHPDESAQAGEANGFDADAFVGLAMLDQPGARVAYYATDDFHSIGGRSLAELVAAELAGGGAGPDLGAEVAGMRLPILRETRMPAVVCEVGDARAVVERGSAVAAALARALIRWVRAPVGS